MAAATFLPLALLAYFASPSDSFSYHLVNWTRHVDTRFRSQPQSAPFPAIDAYRNCERTIGQRAHFVDLSNLDPLNSQSIFGQ